MGAGDSRARPANADPLAGFSVASSSGRLTTLLRKALQVGDFLWHDRDYIVLSPGDFAERQMVFVKASNDDKRCRPTLPMWTLHAPCTVTVYINFWGGAGQEQLNRSWLRSPTSAWEPAHMEGVSFGQRQDVRSRGPGRVYMQTFPAGQIHIMGQEGDHGLLFAFLEFGARQGLADQAAIQSANARSDPLMECDILSCSRRITTLKAAVPRAGDQVWYDRRWTFTSLGGFAGKQMVYIKGSNDDKVCAPHEAMWTLEAACDVTVYLDFWGGELHERINEHWLKCPTSEWELTDMTGVAFEVNGVQRWGPGRVYKQSFPAGRIEVMGKGNCDHGTVLAFLEEAGTFVISLAGRFSEELQAQVLSATNLAGREEVIDFGEVADQPLSFALDALAARYEVPLHRLRAVSQDELILEQMWQRPVRQVVACEG